MGNLSRASLILATTLGALNTQLVRGDELSDEYRALTLRVRDQGAYMIPMPSGDHQKFDYRLKLAKPLWDRPLVQEFPLEPGSKYAYRTFWDKIFAEDGSFLHVGGEQLPLTCVFVYGQDNRDSGNTSPLLPELLLRVYLVANDFTCTGPVNPAWPGNGRREMWDTFLYFEVKDPTIMLPVESHLRYRWNEFPAIALDEGRGV